MKKKIIIFCAAFFGVFFVFALFHSPPVKYILSYFFGSSDQPMSSTERIARMIQDTHPTDLMIYGDDVLFEMQTPARRLNEFTEDTLQKQNGCECSFLVINDLSGTVQLSESDIRLLDTQLRAMPFCLMYLGDQYGNAWGDPNEYTISIPGNRCYQYNMEYGKLCREVGAWREQQEEAYKQNPYLLGDVILYQIEEFVSSLEQSGVNPSLVNNTTK